MERKLYKFLIINFILFLCFSNLLLAQSGGIKGKILDDQTKDPLPYANIVFISTGFGASTDFEGNYILRNIPVGTYNVKISYLGYKPIVLKIEILLNKMIEKDFRLTPESIEGIEDVVVTAQVQGQQHAINAQLNSTSVKNVVSSAKIQELPDANAAESVSRLPGISLIRTGGEGSRVVVRGLSPQYNQITIDGVELSGNVPSGLSDRGTDLSMISSNMLGSIEVIKAITPDMDATAIGGVVNFGMRKAAKGKKNRTNIFNNYLSGVELISQGSYNGLKSTYGDYKLVGSVERRYFDERLGVFIQGNVEEKNLSSNILGVGYVLEDKTHGDDGIPLLSNMSLTDVHRIRNRYGGTVTFDYEHSTGDIGFMNFLSISDTKVTKRSESFPSDAGSLTYSILNDPFTLVNYSNLLSIKQDISIFQADIKFSHSYSEREAPGTARFNFPQLNAVDATLVPELRKMHPKELATYMTRSAQSAYLLSIGYENNITKDRAYTGSVNFTTDLNLGDILTSKIKFGGAYQYRDRSYDREYWYGSMFDDGQTVALALAEQLNVEPVALGGSGSPLKTLSYYDFITKDYDYGKFLKGDYTMGEPADLDMILKASKIARANAGKNIDQVGFKKLRASSKTSDYTGSETKSAGYIMASINLGTQLTLTPGVRYQNLTTEFTGSRGLALVAGDLQDTIVTEKLSHGYFLPMVHLKYRPFTWFQIHFAYTNTLNYPAFSRITPRYLIGQNSISYNNFRLKPAKSENFDLALSIFNNEIGLFTINGFNKNITDLIFSAGKRFPTKEEIAEKYPEIPPGFVAGRNFYTYINNKHKINVYGVEVDWQTHFWYLPGFLSGIVFNINYTHIFSDAKYPRTERRSLGFDPATGTEKYKYIDTFYVARLLNQPKDIINLSIGYDYGGFSGRLSAFYQDNVFKRPNFWLQERTHSDKYFRLDLSVKQKLPWYGIQVYFNLNNITAEEETDLNQKTAYPAAQRHYGMSGDLGIKLQL
ncbi:MAG: hypothetical protein CR986_00305 [Ignavibacteriae bacterium]|nr:MAG: hypothetical protein CR986_00305 [Ignavibacteriota bacterium]